MDKTEFEDKIKSILTEELEVPEGFEWNDLKDGIDRPEEKPKRRLIAWYWWVGGFVIFVISVLWYKVYLLESDVIAILKNNTTVDSAAVNQQTLSKLDYVNTNLNTNLSEPTVTAHKESSIIIPNEPKNISALSKTKQTISNKFINELDDYSTTSNDLLKEKKEIQVLSNNVISSVKNSINLNTSTDQSVHQYDDLTDHLALLPTQITFLSYNSHHKLPILKKEDVLQTIATPNAIYKWKLNWTSGLNHFQSQATSSNNTYQTVLKESLIDRKGFYSDVHLSLSLSERLSIQTGISYQLYQEQFYFRQIDTTIITEPNVPIAISVNTFTGNSELISGERSRKEIVTRDVGQLNRYTLIEIPMYLSYQFIKNDQFNIQLLVGMGISQKFTSGKYVNSTNQIIDLKQTGYLQHQSTTCFGSIGLQTAIKLNHRWDILTSIKHQKYLNNWSSNPELDIKPSIWNIGIGFQLNL